MLRQSYRNRTRPCAHIDYAHRIIPRNPLQYLFDQMLGLRPRYQHIGRHAKAQPIEFLLARDVLNRHRRQPLRDALFELRLLLHIQR